MTFLYKRLSYLFQLLEKKQLRYSGHSFRSGSASTASNHGFHDYKIKCIGHWSSHAYQRYIHHLKPNYPPFHPDWQPL